MNACDVEVVVVECCGVNDYVMTGGSVEMTVARLPWLVKLLSVGEVSMSNYIKILGKIRVMKVKYRNTPFVKQMVQKKHHWHSYLNSFHWLAFSRNKHS